MSAASVIAVSVGTPRLVEWRGDTVLTSIFKTPLARRVWVHATNITGDEQSDRIVHGGHWKSVYVYPAEHYPEWLRDLELPALSWGAFGENLTTTGLRESVVCVGDRLRVGSAEFMVTQPRTPCYKLGVRFDRDDMVARFASVDRSGFYLAVEHEGEIGAGDAVEVIDRDARGLTARKCIVCASAPDRASGSSLRQRIRRSPRGGESILCADSRRMSTGDGLAAPREP